MRQFILIISIVTSTISFGQIKKIVGTFESILPGFEVIFNEDSTFKYITRGLHPTFLRWENFSEKGKWSMSGDTIILNPQLSKKIFVESDFSEEENPGDQKLLLTFNHIKRYFGMNGNVFKTDTIQIDRLDYSFNEIKKKKLTRVTPFRSSRCTFAGYIPKEIITTERTISIQKPAENIRSIFIGCYELRGRKEFVIKNKNSNHFTFNVYSNYYQDGQIRQVKFLIKNENVIYTRQKRNGEFKKDNIWSEADAKLKKQKCQLTKL